MPRRVFLFLLLSVIALAGVTIWLAQSVTSMGAVALSAVLLPITLLATVLVYRKRKPANHDRDN